MFKKCGDTREPTRGYMYHVMHRLNDIQVDILTHNFSFTLQLGFLIFIAWEGSKILKT